MSSLVAQWVKNPMSSLLWCGFDPQPGDFCMPQAQPKKKKKKKMSKDMQNLYEYNHKALQVNIFLKFHVTE